MAYFHGIYSNEVPTSLIAPTQIDTGISVVVGTAPTHLAKICSRSSRIRRETPCQSP